MLFHQNTCKTGHNAVQMSQVFHDNARFERFTEPNLFKYVFNVIQNWEMDALVDGTVMVEGDKNSQLRTAN